MVTDAFEPVAGIQKDTQTRLDFFTHNCNLWVNRLQDDYFPIICCSVLHLLFSAVTPGGFPAEHPGLLADRQVR